MSERERMCAELRSIGRAHIADELVRLGKLADIAADQQAEIERLRKTVRKAKQLTRVCLALFDEFREALAATAPLPTRTEADGEDSE